MLYTSLVDHESLRDPSILNVFNIFTLNDKQIKVIAIKPPFKGNVLPKSVLTCYNMTIVVKH